MPRLTRIEDVLFPVQEHPVFAHVKNPTDCQQLPVPHRKAIVDVVNRRVVGIVSQGYRLVTNREALELARQCCRRVFPDTKPGEWEATATDAPGSGGHCHIDLAHNSTVHDFNLVRPDQRPDAFGPFIRVTNSYNGLRALAFDIGFFRKVCKNGLIVPKSIIRFKFSHQHRDIDRAVLFEVADERLTKLKAGFCDQLGALRSRSVPRNQFEAIVFGALSIHRPGALKPESREAAEWKALGSHVGELRDRYVNELGENAYSVFNAVTEFASQPPHNHFIHRDRNSLQRLAGVWFTKFVQECRQPAFDLAAYVARLLGYPQQSSKRGGEAKSAEGPR